MCVYVNMFMREWRTAVGVTSGFTVRNELQHVYFHLSFDNQFQWLF